MAKSSRFDKVLNAAIAVAALVCLGAWGNYYYQRSAAPSPPTDLSSPMFDDGEEFPAQPGVTLGSDTASLVFFLTERCGICVESIPFYRTLAKENQRLPKPLRLVAFSFDAQRTVESFLNRSELSLHAVHSVSPDAFKLRGTPTLILVDRGGRVLRSWQGRLSEGRQKDVLDALQEAAAIAER